MRNHLLRILMVWALAGWMATPAHAAGSEPPGAPRLNGIAPPPAPATQPCADPQVDPARFLLVPFDELHVLLQGGDRRVLLPQAEYEQLLQKGKVASLAAAPRRAAIVAAEYQVTLDQERANLAGRLIIDVLEPGLQAVDLELGGLGLRAATLDDQPAPIASGTSGGGDPVLLVQGAGRHTLMLDMVAPVQTTAARQTLQLRLPTGAASRLTLLAPGDVEIKSGAAVASRVYDASTNQTRAQLLPTRGPLALVLSLNQRTHQDQRLLLARSVVLNHIDQAQQRLRTRLWFSVLHQAVQTLRFAVPEGFEIAQVQSDRMQRWTVQEQDSQRVLEVYLREPATQTLTLDILATAPAPPQGQWQMQRLRPLDVVGDAAILGLVLDRRLTLTSLESQGLIPIDHAALAKAISPSLGQTDGDGRIVAACYAPQPEFHLAGRFQRQPAELWVTSQTLLVLAKEQLRVQGALALTPQHESLYELALAVPPHWHVTTVTDAQQQPLRFEQWSSPDGQARLRIALPQGVTPGQSFTVRFAAQSVPPEWLASWADAAVAFPVFTVPGAARDRGVFAVQATDDLAVQPATMESLIPLDEADKARHGLADVPTDLAYRYDRPPAVLALSANRVPARLTAHTYSFFRLRTDRVESHYELVYDVAQARTDHVAMRLPLQTPTALSIRGLDDAAIKEYTSEDRPDHRRWLVTLAKPQRGRVRLAVDFETPLAETAGKQVTLPVVAAEDVVYQSGHVAVEGDAELAVEVSTPMRRADVGELVDAAYQPGRRLLGVYRFAGPAPAISAAWSRPALYALPPVLVQRAEIATVLDLQGVSQTAVRFLLLTKVPLLEVRLPQGAALWSVVVDGKPIKPQRDDAGVLVNLPAADGHVRRDVTVLYESPIQAVSWWNRLSLEAPRLFHRADNRAAEQVPTADLSWHLYVADDAAVTASRGLATPDLHQPRWAATSLLGWIGRSSGGLQGPLCLLPRLGAARRTSRQMQNNTQLRGIHSGMVLYAQDKGVYPPDLGTLYLDNYFTAEYVINPTAPISIPADLSTRSREEQARWVNQNTTYVMVMAGQKPTTNPRRIAVIDKPQPGATHLSVAYEDNHVALEQRETVDRLLREQTGRSLEEIVAAAESQAWAGAVGGESAPAAGYLFGMDAANGRGVPQAVPQSARPAPKKPGPWALQGMSSLPIDLQRLGQSVQFRGFDGDARLQITVARPAAWRTLGWALAVAVIVVGVLLTNQPLRTRATWWLAVVAVAVLTPLVTGRAEAVYALNPPLLAAALLAIYYVLVGFGRWIVRARAIQTSNPVAPVAPGAGAAVILMALLGFCPDAQAQSATVEIDPTTLTILPDKPLPVPPDAILVPYDPDKGPAATDHTVLIPYAQYEALWNRAYPDQRLATAAPPAEFALANAQYSARLQGEESLLLQGSMDVAVYVDRNVAIPLPLTGGVLAQVLLDGQPARLGLAAPTAGAAPRAAGDPMASSMVVLYVSGKGSHRLELSIGLKLQRQSGWITTDARVPAATATALNLLVPAAATEVRLGQLPDRPRWETQSANQTIRTALAPHGRLQLQWRPQIAQSTVDRGLTATSTAVFDVQEDDLALTWTVELTFGPEQRESFDLDVPADYLVERIDGPNIRGWQGKADQQAQRLTVNLLKPARQREVFTLLLRRPTGIAVDPAAQHDPLALVVPVVRVAQAPLQTGSLTIRRSPLLDLRTTRVQGATRADLPQPVAPATTEPASPVASPLGLRPYEAYRFATASFAIELQAAPIAADISARLQTILRLAQQQQELESRILLDIRHRPVHRLRVAIPAPWEVTQLSVSSDFATPESSGSVEWSVSQEEDRRVLVIRLAQGRQGSLPIVLRGQVSSDASDASPVPLPHLVVLEADDQEGELVVQTDPSFSVQPAELKDVQPLLLSQVFSWLAPSQRDLSQLALRHRGRDYQGQLRLIPRQPEVTGYCVTNVRITDRALEETIFLHLAVHQAGIRQIVFQLPARMRDARIQVPLLRQKIVEPIGDPAGAMVRVRLILQDAVIGPVKVLVEHDRPLPDGAWQAPIAQVEGVKTMQTFVAVQNASRDEVVFEQVQGLDPLGRQQSQWQTVASLLRGAMTQVFVASDAAAPVSLTLRMHQRPVVETVTARIGLSQTVLVLDESGSYRAQQTYRLDNRTEQFLEVQMPQGAELWSALVAGEPVKPVAAGAPRRLRIPLVKTSPGDLDYAVVLRYAGRLDSLGRYAAVDFPFIRAMNIGVELSQARLLLPESYRWMSFGGTLEQVQDQDELALTYADYRTRMAQRLLGVMSTSSADAYSKVRAAENLEALDKELKGLQEVAQRQAGDSKAAQRQAELGEKVLRQTDEQLRQLRAQTAPADQGGLDNRFNLSGEVQNQKVSRASNVATQAGSNFRMDADKPAGAATQPAEQDRLRRDQSSSLGIRGGIGWKDQSVNAPKETEAKKREEAASDELSRVRRYQQKVQAQQQAPQAAALPAPAMPAREVAGQPANLSAPSAASQSGTGGAGVGPPAGPTGLASLDVELPMRGREYHFTSVRGDVALTGRAVSRSTTGSLVRLGVAALLVLVLWGGWRLVSRVTWPRIGASPRRVTVVLVLVATLLLILGVFPIWSALGVLAGLTVLSVWRVMAWCC